MSDLPPPSEDTRAKDLTQDWLGVPGEPIQEGVVHGPHVHSDAMGYSADSRLSHQVQKNQQAIYEARAIGAITTKASEQLLRPIRAQQTVLRDKEQAYQDELYELEQEDNEDPLEGDVDRWVHPDETRTDEQIARDEKYASNLDDDDDYWDEYDELHSDDELEPMEDDEDDITAVAAEKAKGILADVPDSVPEASDSGYTEDV